MPAKVIESGEAALARPKNPDTGAETMPVGSADSMVEIIIKLNAVVKRTQFSAGVQRSMFSAVG
jgi:hypothetical protein